MREFDARPPRAVKIWAILYVGGFIIIAAVALVRALVRGGDVGGAAPVIVMAAWAEFVGWRVAGVSCRGRGRELVIRNYLRTRCVPVSRIQGLDIGRGTGGSRMTVRVLTDGAAIPVDVMATALLGSRRQFERGRQRLEHRRWELTAWIAEANLDMGDMPGTADDPRLRSA